MKATKNKIDKIFKDATAKAQEELENQAKATLLEIKLKHKHKSVELVCSMGTWIYKIDGKIVDNEKSFTKLNDLLDIMSGEYDLWLGDIKV